MLERKKTAYKAKTKPLGKVDEKGNAVSYVEEQVSRSIEDLFKQMIQKNEIRTVTRMTARDFGESSSRDRAVKMMNDAEESPFYMETGKVQEIKDKMKTASVVVNEAIKKAKTKAQIKAEKDSLRKEVMEELKIKKGESNED